MVNLTIEKAEEIAKETANKMKDEEEREFFILHSKAVGDVALILAEKKDVDKEMLRIAGWVHDIGKVGGFEGHAKVSVEMLEKDYELDDKLKDAILNHGSKDKPETEEGKVIQVADKVCFLNPEVVSLLVKYNDKKIKQGDIDFLKKMVNGAVEFLEGFDLE